MESDGRPAEFDASGRSKKTADAASGRPGKTSAASDTRETGSRKRRPSEAKVAALAGATTALLLGCLAAILIRHALTAQIDRELVTTASTHSVRLQSFASQRREQLLNFRDSDAVFRFLNSSTDDDTSGSRDATLDTIRSVSRAMNQAGGFDTVTIVDRNGRMVLSTGLGQPETLAIDDLPRGGIQLDAVNTADPKSDPADEVRLRWIASVPHPDGTIVGAVIGETNADSLQSLFADRKHSIPAETWVLVRKNDQWIAPLCPSPDGTAESHGEKINGFPLTVLNGQQSTAFQVDDDGKNRLAVWDKVTLTPDETLPCNVALAADPAVAYAPADQMVRVLGLITFIAVTILVALVFLSERLFAGPPSPPPPITADPPTPRRTGDPSSPRHRSKDDAQNQATDGGKGTDAENARRTGSDAAPSSSARPAQLDWHRVLKSMGGNRDMLREIALAMQAECPQCMSQIDEAVNTDDQPLLSRSAHTIKGSLRLFGPSVAQNLATEIEQHSKAGDLNAAKKRVPQLRREIDGFLAELDAFVSEFESQPLQPEPEDEDSDISWDRPAPGHASNSPKKSKGAPQTTPKRTGASANSGGETVPVGAPKNHDGSDQDDSESGEYFSVLIIEDSDVDAMVVDQRLKSDGRFLPTRTSTLQQGCRRLQKSPPPDAVILDLNLPDSAGLNTFKTIHQQFPLQPVVVLTGEKDEAQAMEAMREGAQDYVYKSSLDEAILIRALLYAIERNKRKVAEQRQRDVESELELAKQIQQHLLPQEAPVISGFDVAGRCVSADATSGDLFDFIDHGDGKWDIVLADVCGHGLGPAMITVGARRLLRSTASLNEDVGSLLTIANQGICEDLFGSLFVALFFARLDSEGRQMTYVGAGQPAFLIDSDGNGSMLASSGIPTGIEAEFQYTTDGEIDLSGDHLLLLMTDGIWEAHEDALNPFGKERAFDVVHKNRHRPSREIVDALIEAVRAHCLPGQPKDDITVVVIKPDEAAAS